MSKAIERVLAIEDRIDELWASEHAGRQERDRLLREKSSILMSISWSERMDLEHLQAERAVKALDQISAVRAKR